MIMALVRRDHDLLIPVRQLSYAEIMIFKPQVVGRDGLDHAMTLVAVDIGISDKCFLLIEESIGGALEKRRHAL